MEDGRLPGPVGELTAISVTVRSAVSGDGASSMPTHHAPAGSREAVTVVLSVRSYPPATAQAGQAP
jgi:hypothetical protein